jgi:hypothetical protein
MIDLIEEIINSPFIWLVFQAPTLRKLGRKSDDVSGSYNLLAQEIRNLFKEEYTNLVSELFEQYNKRVPEEKKLKLSDELWANDVPPKIGSGRP